MNNIIINNELLEFLNEHDGSVGIYSVTKIDNEIISEIEENFNLQVIDYKENYFIYKDESNYNVYHRIFDGTWNELIFTQKEYDSLLYKNSEEIDIYNNGLDVCRINFYMDSENFNNAIQFMRDNNMYTFDDSNILDFSIRQGNNCLPYVPIKFVSEIENYLNMKIKKDLFRHFLGKKEIEKFIVGQKVEIIIYNTFGDTTVKGTVTQTYNNKIHVRPYKSKNKYYELKVLSECSINVIDSFK